MCSYIVYDFALFHQGRSTATNYNFGQHLSNKNTQLSAIWQQKREEKSIKTSTWQTKESKLLSDTESNQMT
jgi:hypothetical protein